MMSQSAAVLKADNGKSYVKLTAGDRLQINAKDSSLRNEKTVVTWNNSRQQAFL